MRESVDVHAEYVIYQSKAVFDDGDFDVVVLSFLGDCDVGDVMLQVNVHKLIRAFANEIIQVS